MQRIAYFMLSRAIYNAPRTKLRIRHPRLSRLLVRDPGFEVGSSPATRSNQEPAVSPKLPNVRKVLGACNA